MLTPLFGGFAATGAVARTATTSGTERTSPLAGMVHAAFLVLVIVLFAPWAASVPLAALRGYPVLRRVERCATCAISAAC
jgi:SulP family sulfate permease